MIEVMMPFDGHVHLRQGALLKFILSFYAGAFGGIVVEPNLHPRPVLDYDDMVKYHDEICWARDELGAEIEILLLFQVTEATTWQMVERMCRLSYCAGGKSYYWGTTTHAETGIKIWQNTIPALKAIRDNGKVSQQHGEMPLNFPRISWFRREPVFFQEIAPRLIDAVPGIEISFEHLSTGIGVDFVWQTPPNVHGGLTMHHAETTMDDVEGGLLHPHLFCKPHPKDYDDQDKILAAMLSGHEKFHFASDNAAHFRSKKECSDGCAGVWLGPVIPQRVVERFEANNAMEKLEPFLCINNRLLYKQPLPKRKLQFVRQPYDVLPSYSTGIEGEDTHLVSYLAGEKVAWQIVRG